MALCGVGLSGNIVGQTMANPEHEKLLKRPFWVFLQKEDAWNRWRKARPDVVPDLHRTFLHQRDLHGYDFSGADLRHANFVGANLRYCNFKNAKLDGAYMNSADMSRSILIGATLGDTDLTQVNLTKAWMSGANFEGVNLGGTIFGDNNLTEVQNLSEAIHRYPSVIGIETIYNSSRQIPDVFLRGCGWSDLEIATSKLLHGQLNEFESDELLARLAKLRRGEIVQHQSCFISYSHADKAFAQRIFDALQALGVRCWLDEKRLLPGDDIYEEVSRGIKLSDKLLLCCSKSSLESWWVDNEITTAFGKEQQMMKEYGRKVLALIPLNLDGYLFEWKNGKASQILTRFAADFTNWQQDGSKFDLQVQRIIQALQGKDEA